MRTASIKLGVTPEQAQRLAALRAAYADSCNRLVPTVIEHRCWNRVALHQLSYTRLRQETPLGAQMVCNTIFSVCKAYRAQSKLGRIRAGALVPAIRFERTSVHFDKRTYTLKGETVSLNTLKGRIVVPLILGAHQRRILEGGKPKEAELICRKGRWYFNLVVESDEVEPVASGPVVGVDVGENNLAVASTGKVWGGEQLRHRRDQYLALRRRLQSNGSQSARQKLRRVSGTHSRGRIKAGKRVRARLHRWAFRQLQGFVEYKAQAAGIAVEYVDPAYTSQTCCACGQLGRRVKHRFECSCGLRAHADCNASRNLARIGGSALPPRAAVDRPTVGCVGNHAAP